MRGMLKLFNSNGEGNVSIPFDFGWHVERNSINLDNRSVAQFSNGLWMTEWGDSYDRWRIDMAGTEVVW